MNGDQNMYDELLAAALEWRDEHSGTRLTKALAAFDPPRSIDEPTWIGASVRDRDGAHWIRAFTEGCEWVQPERSEFRSWWSLVSAFGPIRHETAAERAERGAPALLPGGHIAIPAEVVTRSFPTTKSLRARADELDKTRAYATACIFRAIADVLDAEAGL